MINRVQVSALVVVPLASVAVSLWLAGEPISWTWFKSLGGAVSATVAALTVFELWLWRLHILQGWFVKRPILIGTWDFTIKSMWTDPETGQRPDPIQATATIRQRYSKLHLHLETPESAGDFVSSNVVAKDDGTYQIAGVFRNEPRLSVRDRSPIHLGALVLDVVGEPASPSELKGHYWTDRGTSGEIHGQRPVQR